MVVTVFDKNVFPYKHLYHLYCWVAKETVSQLANIEVRIVTLNRCDFLNGRVE